MLNTQPSDLWINSVDAPQQVTELSPADAKKIINIAGVSPGDRVLYLGVADKAIQTVIGAGGAGFIAGGTSPWLGMTRHRADVVLCAVTSSQSPSPTGWSRDVRRNLRPGGRAVVWGAPHRYHRASSLDERIKRLIRPEQFTNIIVGRVPTDTNGLVVATGIRKP